LKTTEADPRPSSSSGRVDDRSGVSESVGINELAGVNELAVSEP
jgi:hypothetical protein